ncbi:septum formation initiator family protein [Candidatus Daviesbacteria bacterium]|nr:septum formation initiator family protein [Candidatus Daviesbacteria bacterium]
MGKKIVLILIGALTIIIAYNLIGQILSTVHSGDKLSQAMDRLHKLEIKNKELKKKLEGVKSPQFLEQQARDKLGLVKEGEVLVIIPQEKIDQVLGLSKKVEEVKLPNPLGWWKLFFK